MRPGESGAGPSSIGTAVPGVDGAAEPDDGLARVGVLVVYGTEFGFSREVAMKAAEAMKGAVGLRPRVVDMADLEARAAHAALCISQHPLRCHEYLRVLSISTGFGLCVRSFVCFRLI